MARLVTAYQPEAIYLFGSYAWGEPNEDSDLDFMVILSSNIEESCDLQRRSGHIMFGLEFATDVLLKNKLRFEKRANTLLLWSIKLKRRRYYLWTFMKNGLNVPKKY